MKMADLARFSLSYLELFLTLQLQDFYWNHEKDFEWNPLKV